MYSFVMHHLRQLLAFIALSQFILLVVGGCTRNLGMLYFGVAFLIITISFGTALSAIEYLVKGDSNEKKNDN